MNKAQVKNSKRSLRTKRKTSIQLTSCIIKSSVHEDPTGAVECRDEVPQVRPHPNRDRDVSNQSNQVSGIKP